ncbi:MAG: hypothetical protein HQL46_01305 [Gammaproteobacteria bacterium]|nr:hypothetical protein [Gammaproteobacteria bacterium]
MIKALFLSKKFQTLSFLFMILLTTACQFNPINQGKDFKNLKKSIKNQLIFPISELSKISFTQNEESFFQHALENNFTQQPGNLKLNWGTLIVVPTKTFINKQGVHCREYKSTYIQKSSQVSINALACRLENHQWLRIQ